MKAVFVSHSADRGGAERCLVELVELMTEVGVESTVVVPRNGPLCDSFARLGVTTIVHPYAWWANKGTQTPALRRGVRSASRSLSARLLAARLRGLAPDVIYSNTIATPCGAMVAQMLGKPHVWHLHEFPEDWCFDDGAARAMQLIESHTKTFVVFTGIMERKWKAWLPDASIERVDPWIALGTQTRRAPPFAHPPFRFVSIGTLERSKRHEDAITATRALLDKGYDVSLRVVGRGYEGIRRRLLQQIQDDGLDAHVTLVGELDDVFAELTQTDAVLVCSSQETLGRVTLEAMSAGCPVVAAGAGANAEIVTDGATGLLHEPGNPWDLYRKLERLCTEEGLAERLTTHARAALARRFRREPYRDALWAVLQRSLGPLTSVDYTHRASERPRAR